MVVGNSFAVEVGSDYLVVVADNSEAVDIVVAVVGNTVVAAVAGNSVVAAVVGNSVAAEVPVYIADSDCSGLDSVDSYQESHQKDPKRY